jgi:prevent-host-death family protein
MNSQRWTVTQARSRFSEILDKAEAEGPQTITRNGRVTAVVVAACEWERKTRRRGNLAQFFASSPLRGARLKIRRFSGRARKIW